MVNECKNLYTTKPGCFSVEKHAQGHIRKVKLTCVCSSVPVTMFPTARNAAVCYEGDIINNN